MKLTKAKLKYLIKDERKASKEYRKLGLPTLARDEARHKRILTRRLKKKENPYKIYLRKHIKHPYWQGILK